MADASYHRLLAEYRKRGNYGEVFRSALDNVSVELDFSHVKSCLAVGTGSGEREIEFVRRLLPNLRSFTAVEPDPDSAEALRANFREGQLPGVETSVVETSIESWSGGGDVRVDAVLLINVLGHLDADYRRSLFQQLMSQYLNDSGIVAICDNITSVPSGYPRLMERLGKPRHDYDKVEKDMLETGFRVVFKQDLKIAQDLSNPSDGIVKAFQLLTGQDESQVRAAIDDVFTQPDMHVSLRKFAIFTKD